MECYVFCIIYTKAFFYYMEDTHAKKHTYTQARTECTFNTRLKRRRPMETLRHYH